MNANASNVCPPLLLYLSLTLSFSLSADLTVLFTKAANRQAEQGPGPQHFHLTLSPITTIGVNDTTKEIKCSSEAKKTTAAHDQE